MWNFLKNSSKIIGLVLIFQFIFVLPNVSIAQGGPGDDPDVPGIPIDGGLSLLLAAGAGYGGKKIYDQKKNK